MLLVISTNDLLAICYFQDGVYICSHASYAIAVVTNLNMLIAGTNEAHIA